VGGSRRTAEPLYGPGRLFGFGGCVTVSVARRRYREARLFADVPSGVTPREVDDVLDVVGDEQLTVGGASVSVVVNDDLGDDELDVLVRGDDEDDSLTPAGQTSVPAERAVTRLAGGPRRVQSPENPS
jgi:hypothetical protein